MSSADLSKSEADLLVQQVNALYTDSKPKDLRKYGTISRRYSNQRQKRHSVHFQKHH